MILFGGESDTAVNGGILDLVQTGTEQALIQAVEQHNLTWAQLVDIRYGQFYLVRKYHHLTGWEEVGEFIYGRQIGSG